MSAASTGAPVKMTGPRSRVKDSKFDSIHWKLWMLQVTFFSIVSIIALATLIAGSFKNAGFPCFYGIVVDYTVLNGSETEGVWRHMGGSAPALFLEMRETVFFFYFVTIAMLIVVCFVIAGSIVAGIELNRNPGGVRASLVTSMLASPSCLVIGTFATWTIQTTVHLLAHKLAVLSASMYIVHFGFLASFFAYFCGRGLSKDSFSVDLHTIREANTRIFRIVGPGRAVITNVISCAVGMSTAPVALMIGLILANSFAMSLWPSVMTAGALFAVLALIFMLACELLIAHYVHVLVCPQLGVLVACGMVGVSGNAYLQRYAYVINHQAPYLSVGFRTIVTITAVLSVVFMIVRIVRAYLYHRQNYTRFYGKVNRANKKIIGYIKDKRAKIKNGLKSSYKYSEIPSKHPIGRTALSSFSEDDEVIYEQGISNNNDSLVSTGDYEDSEWDD